MKTKEPLIQVSILSDEHTINLETEVNGELKRIYEAGNKITKIDYSSTACASSFAQFRYSVIIKYEVNNDK